MVNSLKDVFYIRELQSKNSNHLSGLPIAIELIKYVKCNSFTFGVNYLQVFKSTTTTTKTTTTTTTNSDNSVTSRTDVVVLVLLCCRYIIIKFRPAQDQYVQQIYNRDFTTASIIMK
ncbi:hypothetical protein ACTA71_003496 [Dictyostelium dimigraforme]